MILMVVKRIHIGVDELLGKLLFPGALCSWNGGSGFANGTDLRRRSNYWAECSVRNGEFGGVYGKVAT